MAEITEVLSFGEVVGSLCDARLDMWYLEGVFSPSTTPAGIRFAADVAALDPRDVMADPTKGIRVEIRDPPSEGRTTFVVMSLSGGRLFGRCVFDPREVAWVVQNVPVTSNARPHPPRRPWWRFW